MEDFEMLWNTHLFPTLVADGVNDADRQAADRIDPTQPRPSTSGTRVWSDRIFLRHNSILENIHGLAHQGCDCPGSSNCDYILDPASKCYLAEASTATPRVRRALLAEAKASSTKLSSPTKEKKLNKGKDATKTVKKTVKFSLPPSVAIADAFAFVTDNIPKSKPRLGVSATMTRQRKNGKPPKKTKRLGFSRLKVQSQDSLVYDRARTMRENARQNRDKIQNVAASTASSIETILVPDNVSMSTQPSDSCSSSLDVSQFRNPLPMSELPFPMVCDEIETDTITVTADVETVSVSADGGLSFNIDTPHDFSVEHVQDMFDNIKLEPRSTRSQSKAQNSCVRVTRSAKQHCRK